MPAAMAGGSGGMASGPRSLDCRSFWKAGAFEAPSAAARGFHDMLETGDFDRARVHPKFLHTNATSHKWAFGAIAELLDNAVDEICNGATFVKVDKSINLKDSRPMLVFQDDGGGMDPEGVRQCMSLGFSTKKSKTTIGQYGNGFKTSTMRLGADAIVFTRAIRGSNVTLSVGLLSYTFLRRTMKDDIVVPVLDFQIQDDHIVPLVYGSQGDWDSSLKIILDWSPFSSMEELLQQFKDIESHGTKVVIYDLWMNDDGLLELDFDDDDEDILLRDQAKATAGTTKIQKEIIEQHISHRLRFSLRAYTSILYLKKYANFQIILRGKVVEHINIAHDLKFKKMFTYKPQVALDSQVVSVKVDVGFAKEAPVLGIFGMNVYHKNRLIMPFWKVLQEGSSRGRSVVGVLEANFIEPAHDKQDFERTPLFIRLETKLRQIIIEYWKNNCHLIGYQPMNPQLKTQYKAAKGSGGPGHEFQQKSSTAQRIGVHSSSTAQRIGAHSSNLLPETYDDAAVFGLRTNGAGSGLQFSGQAQENGTNSAGLEEDLVNIASDGELDPNFLEKLSDENISLFTRREELKQRDTQLKQTILELEHELEETKRKCSQLSTELQVRKSQQQLPYM
ncbi:unnamed protein product [Triticum turgidum subsp. durum]|uniref:Morc S5 domain-containing protein n=1 Tax=Triticum turgidum subsp. durum TaxID=4567 RepID=A0A9R0ZHC6_TRITD|nr:unnamed protein product [Triticum turgidum subsp. durum]